MKKNYGAFIISLLISTSFVFTSCSKSNKSSYKESGTKTANNVTNKSSYKESGTKTANNVTNKSSNQEEELESNKNITKTIPKENLNVLKNNMEKDLNQDIQKLDKYNSALSKHPTVNLSQKNLKNFIAEVKEQRDDTKSFLDKVSETKKPDYILEKEKNDLQALIKDEISRFDKIYDELQNNKANLVKRDLEIFRHGSKHNLGKSALNESELKDKIAKQLNDIKKTRDEMAKRVIVLNTMGADGYDEAKSYTEQVKKGFENEMLFKISSLDLMVNDLREIMPKKNFKNVEPIKDFKEKKVELERLLKESQAVSVVNWKDIRKDILASFDKMENEFKDVYNKFAAKNGNFQVADFYIINNSVKR
jgi:hypothetical protein